MSCESIEINVFQVFGSDAYVHLPKKGRTKLDAKAKKSIFVDYYKNVKGFRIFDTDSNIIKIVRNLKFLFNEFSGNEFIDEVVVTPESDEGEKNLAAVRKRQMKHQNRLAYRMMLCGRRHKTKIDGIDESNIVGERLRGPKSFGSRRN
jgi:hypothetical protein